MNKDNAAQYLPLVQALAEGRQLQLKLPGDSVFHDVHDVTFQHFPDRYRIKPEPRRAWVWWPPVDSKECYSPEFFLYHGFAENAVKNYGGHITEVTE